MLVPAAERMVLPYPTLCHTLAIMQLQLEKLKISEACVMQHISVLGQLLMTATCCSMCSEKCAILGSMCDGEKRVKIVEIVMARCPHQKTTVVP